MCSRSFPMLLAGAILGLLTFGAPPLEAAGTIVNVAGTTWNLVALSKIKVRGASGTDGGEAVLFFGPGGPRALAEANDCLVEDEGSNPLHGTYTADPKGKVAIQMDPGDLAMLIGQAITDLAEDAGVVFDLYSTSVTSQKTSGKVSKGILKLKLSAKFEVTGTVNGEFYQSKGSFSATLVGPQD